MKILSALSIVLVLSGVLQGKAFAQGGDSRPPAGLPLQFAATAHGQSGAAMGQNIAVNIRITGWTNPQQVHDYITILKEKGQDELLKVLGKAPSLGNVSPVTRTGTEISFATYTAKPNGGMHIVLAAARNMSFGEVARSERSMSYPFAIATLDVDANGKGGGTVAPAVKLKFNKKGQLQVENYGIQPLRLMGVAAQK
jgi:hypothetical protein